MYQVLFLLCEATPGLMLSTYLPMRRQGWQTPSQTADLQHNPTASPGSVSKFLIFLSHMQSRGWAVSPALLEPLLAVPQHLDQEQGQGHPLPLHPKVHGSNCWKSKLGCRWLLVSSQQRLETGEQETPLLQLAVKLPTEDTRNSSLRLSDSKN